MELFEWLLLSTTVVTVVAPYSASPKKQKQVLLSSHLFLLITCELEPNFSLSLVLSLHFFSHLSLLFISLLSYILFLFIFSFVVTLQSLISTLISNLSSLYSLLSSLISVWSSLLNPLSSLFYLYSLFYFLSLPQALQIMNLRNFVTNIMITKIIRETRYQYNDHEV